MKVKLKRMGRWKVIIVSVLSIFKEKTKKKIDRDLQYKKPWVGPRSVPLLVKPKVSSTLTIFQVYFKAYF